MGVAITDLLERKNVSFKELRGKLLMVDGPLWCYQFLTSLRGPDGRPLTNSKGNSTSHVMGLFSRVTALMREGILLAFCFDGKVPDLKLAERDRRAGIKKEAEQLLKQAEDAGDEAGVWKYSSRTVQLTSEMIKDVKQLLVALGIPVIDAPAEAEAQASHIVKRGDAYAVATNDADALLFGSPLVLRNLSIAGRRKKTNKLAYETIEPELISLKGTLSALEITQDQLIALGMLVGTDFNIGGIKGIGPKKGLVLVKEYKQDFEGLFSFLKWDSFFDVSWKTVFDQIKEMPVSDEYSLEMGEVDADAVRELVVGKHEFSTERVDGTLAKLEKELKLRTQKGLGDFF
ncbi:MAG: flap structure-specific endonuclease [Nanoarchaeota archaeon]|nr:flap structure-specific endonuclease [Nanoarchaeota archaeon]